MIVAPIGLPHARQPSSPMRRRGWIRRLRALVGRVRWAGAENWIAMEFIFEELSIGFEMCAGRAGRQELPVRGRQDLHGGRALQPASC
jgi:hypothetical protein